MDSCNFVFSSVQESSEQVGAPADELSFEYCSLLTSIIGNESFDMDVSIPLSDGGALNKRNNNSHSQQNASAHGCTSSPLSSIGDTTHTSWSWGSSNNTSGEEPSNKKTPEQPIDDLVSVASPDDDLCRHQNVFTSITEFPLNGKAINFRQFMKRDDVPACIAMEPSEGVFVGQLPSCYTDEHVKALLKAICNESNALVDIRSIKCHKNLRTCSFIQVNRSARPVLLRYSKRILCDMNCAWVVEADKIDLLPLLVQRLRRDLLCWVPKRALVLEILVPQAMTRKSVPSPSNRYSNSSPYPALSQRLPAELISFKPGTNTYSMIPVESKPVASDDSIIPYTYSGDVIAHAAPAASGASMVPLPAQQFVYRQDGLVELVPTQAAEQPLQHSNYPVPTTASALEAIYKSVSAGNHNSHQASSINNTHNSNTNNTILYLTNNNNNITLDAFISNHNYVRPHPHQAANLHVQPPMAAQVRLPQMALMSGMLLSTAGQSYPSCNASYNNIVHRGAQYLQAQPAHMQLTQQQHLIPHLAQDCPIDGTDQSSKVAAPLPVKQYPSIQTVSSQCVRMNQSQQPAYMAQFPPFQ